AALRSVSTRSASCSTVTAPCSRSSTSREPGEWLERELLVGERLERHPVQRRDTALFDRLAVGGRRVADVLGEVPARVLAVRVAHEAVAGHLRDDRGGGDRGAGRVAVDD